MFFNISDIVKNIVGKRLEDSTIPAQAAQQAISPQAIVPTQDQVEAVDQPAQGKSLYDVPTPEELGMQVGEDEALNRKGLLTSTQRGLGAIR